MGNRYCISFLTMILMLSSCDRWPDTGNLKITVTYSEAVIDNGTISWIQVPAGASAKLFDKDAICLGFKDARMGIGYIGDDLVLNKFSQATDEKGEIVFIGLPAGEYFLTLTTGWALAKYTEKSIEVIDGETLELVKNFTEDREYYEKLEPWDYETPDN